MKTLTLAGSPYEVGFEHGKELGEIIKAYYSFHRVLLQNIPKEIISSTVAQVEDAIRQIYKDALDELMGIADAAGLKYEDIILLNLASEVMRHAQIKDQTGCTAFSAVKDATENKQTIMGKTRDLRYQAYYPFQVAMKVHTTGKFRIFLAEAFVGRVVTGCGINEHGLGLILNVVNINDFTDSLGLHRSFLARLVLEKCKNVNDAIEEFSRNKLAYGGANYLIGDIHGNCALIEKSRIHQAIKYPDNGIITVTNHFSESSMIKFMGRSSQSSQLRLDQITTLLRSNMGKLNVELAKTFLRSHAYGLNRNSICRHDATGVNTVSAYIIDIASKAILISDGHPCESVFKYYT